MTDGGFFRVSLTMAGGQSADKVCGTVSFCDKKETF